jgi:hypothetical protein
MIVRSHMPWPLRWVAGALALGFSAAIALWAFEFGKDIAGLDRDAKQELVRLRDELTEVREARDKAQSIANTAESLLRTERVAQERLATQLRQAEDDNLSLKEDLGFFERLLPATGGSDSGFALRGFQVERTAEGQLRYQLLIMQSGKPSTPFTGRYEITLGGTLEGKAWVQALPGGVKPLQIKQYARVEGRIDYPARAVVKTVQLKVTDAAGVVRATQTVKL